MGDIKLDEDNDEINIDFSKIKKFFKKKKKDKVEYLESEAKQEEEKIESDLKVSPENKELKKEKQEIQKIEKDLKKEEPKAEHIDKETQKVDSEIKEERKSLDKVEEEVDDEEISLDFSKIKNIFKGKKEKKPSSDDEISIDYQKAFGFIKKYHLLLLLIIPLFLSIYLRAMPAYLPITDDWAESQIINMNKDLIRQQVRSQYPNLPDANINQLVNSQLESMLDQGQILITTQHGLQQAPFDQAVEQYSQSFRSRLQKDGQTYLLAIDPYFWMRHAENVLENGHPGDELRNPETGQTCTQKGPDCVPWDTHMFAPLGREVPQDMFNAYFEAYFHKVMSIFNPDQDLMSSAFLIPIILSALCVIPAFFIARRLAGNFGGLIAAIFVAIHPAFLSRTAGGFADTDAYNVLFPLFITWLFLEAFEAKNNWKKSIIFTSLAGLLVGVYSFSWGGWWYIFDFLLASLVIFMIVYLLINRSNIKDILKQDTIKHTVLIFVVFFFSALVFTTLITNFNTFAGAFRGPLGFTKIKEVGITTVWPNVFTTVAEQNTASLNNVVNQIGLGSMMIFLFALVGMSLTLIKKNSRDMKNLAYFLLSLTWFIIIIAIRPQNLLLFLFLIALPIIIKLIMAIYNKNNDIDFKLAIILIIWFASTMYASTKGIRFMLLLVPAFSIAAGITFGFAHRYISEFIRKNLYLDKRLASAIIIILLLLFLINPLSTAYQTGKQEVPSMNDAWYSSLEKINLESEPDAIINSWWDFGHWFKAIGDRAVTFDGTSQNQPMAHWIGHSFLTNDEEKAVGILRMLDCGSNTAFEKLDESIGDTARSVHILHKVVSMDKGEAKDYLDDYVTGEKADEVIKYTHCQPPENYYITSDDMIGKSGVWGHFGIWNFDKALIYNTLKKKEYRNDREKSISFMQERFNYTEGKAEQLYYEVKGIRNSDEANSWIAPWPSYASQNIDCQTKDNLINCPIRLSQTGSAFNIQIDLENETATINTPQQKLHPDAVVYPTEQGIEKFEFKNDTLGYSMTLIPKGDRWSYIMMQSPLEDSMFTRLYFLNGHGLTKFRKFSEERSVVGNRIVTWKVNWDGQEKNIEYFNEEENLNQSSQTSINQTE